MASDFSRTSSAKLSVDQTSLAVDDHRTFLTGVSLFDALGSTPPRDADLDALKTFGVNAVRVWAHWHDPIYRADGALTPRGRTRLLALARRLEARGVTLELVLLRPGQLPGQPFAVFASAAARVKAAQAITEAMKPFRNALFDLYNEHDHADGPITHADARALRDAVKAIDPDRLVTISSTGGHLVTDAGVVDDDRQANVHGEAGKGPESVAVDVLAPHFPRSDDWARSTGARVRAIRAALDRAGAKLPVYLNEERRADDGETVDPGAYRTAIDGAASAGAAGWIFHTAAGFELRKKPFLEALLPGERAALKGLKR